MKTFDEMAALAGAPLVADLGAAAVRLHATHNALDALAAKLEKSPRAEELLVIETRNELRRITEL